MRLEIGWEEISQDPNAVVTVGTFDGVHAGHAAILQFLNERARALGGTSTVMTFDPHPREVITGKPQALLTTITERAERLATLGLDRLVVVPFEQSLSETPAEAYVTQFLRERIGLKAAVVGYDHRFGWKRQGDYALLVELGQKLGFETHEIPAQMVDNELISSTAIRNHLAQCEIPEANRLLGYPYSVTGIVFRGNQLGRTIGFPTANLLPNHPRKILPPIGIYAVTVRLSDGSRHRGMAYIGNRPTVVTNGATWLEVNVFNFDGDLYDQEITVYFHAFSREDQTFASLELLIEALKRDRDHCINTLNSLSL